ncbi:plasmid mobilization protein [Siccirubricoccus phaeus]|uniref:plasmid mobilization protein n=1 Tax=Siccirubricoccus phaeus TaxID=2595053 RepID=UPI0011F0B2E4|nr:hypothetical protein [Siccirubricoccus phaeus]
MEKRRTGRPKLAPGEGREAQLPPVRLTLAERDHVEAQAAAAGISVAEFTRRAVLGLRVQPRRTETEDRLIVALSRVGNLLNQIARAMHTDRPEHADLQAALDHLRTLLALLAGRQ